jgi:hypothetical protein
MGRTLAAGAMVAAALSLGACDDGAGTAPAVRRSPVADRAAGSGELVEGALYVAELHPLNPRVQMRLDPDGKRHRVVSGKAYFRVVNGMLRAAVDVAGAEPAEGPPPDGLHPQHIHAADRCPPASADANDDGIVDVIEGLPFYGEILVPLDGDISNTTSEIPTFPFARDDRGIYHYVASAKLATLEDAIGAKLDLPVRHVVVHGMDLNTPLPPSVQSLPGIPAQLTIPVACGEIRRVR